MTSGAVSINFLGVPVGRCRSAARDFLEVVEDRYNCGFVLITSRLTVDRICHIIRDPTAVGRPPIA